MSPNVQCINKSLFNVHLYKYSVSNARNRVGPMGLLYFYSVAYISLTRVPNLVYYNCLYSF